MSRRHSTPKPKRRSAITVPERACPHVKLVFEEMRRQGVTYDEAAAGSGVTRVALKAWRHKNNPNLDSAEAVLGFLGYEFVPLPTARALPPEVVAELRPIAERLDLTIPAALRLAAEIAYRNHHLSSLRPPT